MALVMTAVNHRKTPMKRYWKTDVVRHKIVLV